MLIDAAVPGDVNASGKEPEKLSKHKDLEIEILCMRNTRTVILVIIRALGNARLSLQKYSNAL